MFKENPVFEVANITKINSNNENNKKKKSIYQFGWSFGVSTRIPCMRKEGDGRNLTFEIHGLRRERERKIGAKR